MWLFFNGPWLWVKRKLHIENHKYFFHFCLIHPLFIYLFYLTVLLDDESLTSANE